MLQFEVKHETCNGCGLCAKDCPAGVIAMHNGFPVTTAESELNCYKCEHCFTICPTASVSILGLDPRESGTLTGSYPDPEKLEALMKGRRSVRHYREENLEPELLQRLLEVAWHAPTGVNTRQVRFTVIDERAKLAALRDEVMSGVSRLVRDNALPPGMEFFAHLAGLWEDKGIDTVFRGAPHFLVASAPATVASPLPDCLIALSYFELFAQANGVGTVWSGLAKWAIDELLPETRKTLGIPDDHLIGYCMAFGKPAVQYQRTVQHSPALIHRVG